MLPRGYVDQLVLSLYRLPHDQRVRGTGQIVEEIRSYHATKMEVAIDSRLVGGSYNTVFTRFEVYFQIQSETETIDSPVDFDMAAVRRVNAPRW